MIYIDNKLISEDVVEKRFICNLEKCKGACCWEGDYGAPLTDEEIELIEEHIETIKDELPYKSIAYLEGNSIHEEYGKERFNGTALHMDGACVFLTYDERGKALCSIEKSYKSGKIPFHKPISCHLYPIRTKIDPHTKIELINYDQWDICNAACELGASKNVRVYEFAKEALIRKYGNDFYEQLDNTVRQAYD